MALNKKPVTGMKDIMPEEMVIRDYVIGVITDTYSKFGFTRIETPCVENIENRMHDGNSDGRCCHFDEREAYRGIQAVKQCEKNHCADAFHHGMQNSDTL